MKIVDSVEIYPYENMPEEISIFYSQLEKLNSIDEFRLLTKVDSLSEIYTGYWKEVLVAERIALSFILSDGQLKPLYSGVSKDGLEIGFPMLSNFSHNHIIYLENRINQVENPYLLSRYNHILFELKKNNKYAIEALNAYKQIVSKKINNETEDRFYILVPVVIKLTERSKYKVIETKNELLYLVHSVELSVSDKFFIFNCLATSKIIKSKELIFYLTICKDWIDKENVNYFHNINILKLAIKISIANKLDPTDFYENLAENEDILLSEHIDDKDFLKPEIYAHKMDYYKKANNVEKYNEALKEYTRVKSLTELPLIRIPLDEGINKMLNENLNKQVKQKMCWDSDRILYYLSKDSSLYPDLNNVINETKKNYQNSISRFAKNTTFDINNNLKELSDKEDFEQEIFKSYEFRLSLTAIIFFSKLLFNSIVNGKINYIVLFNYFQKYSWYAQRLPKPKMNINEDECDTYCWLDLLSPGLFYFFSTAESYVLSGFNEKNNNWVLCLDSLSLKIEGALRDFIKLLGGGTSKIKDGVTKEMNLEELLNSEKAVELFSENDLALFKMVLTNRGDNIRNNIAHCFYGVDHYSFEKMCKVIFCVLRLGNYKLTLNQQV